MATRKTRGLLLGALLLAVAGGLIALTRTGRGSSADRGPPDQRPAVVVGPTVSYNENEVEVLKVEPAQPDAWEPYADNTMGMAGLRVKAGRQNQILRLVLRYGVGGKEKVEEIGVAAGGRYLRGRGNLIVLTTPERAD